jgi:bacterioferritin (cytochrome b1)
VVNRRAFLRAAGVTTLGGPAVLLAACGGGGATTTTPGPTSAQSDVDILNNALNVENTAIAIYATAMKKLTGANLGLAKQFFTQEMAHADALGKAVQKLGGTPSLPQPSYAAAIGHPRTDADMLTLAETIETTAIAAYLDALPKLSDPTLRQTVAAIMTSDAEHLSVLRTSLKLSPVPVPFVRGSA